MQTIEEIKEDLPDVNVQLSKKIIAVGRLCGRKNQFATVTCLQDGIPISYEYALETVAHCINNDTPLRV
jgi:hypothetical protein